MKREKAIEYIGHYVEDAGGTAQSTAAFEITPDVRLVGYQCGFEPMFVAVRSTAGNRLDDGDAEDCAVEQLESIGWFAGTRKEADYII